MKISTLGGNTTLHFTYDAIGPMSVNYDGTEYYYLRNAQGDVTGLVDADGTQVVTYTYDAWGNPLSVTGSKSHTIGKDNPFRYRGYFYDTETGLYYLNSRYYNPQTTRFINADGYTSTGQGIFGCNMFTYGQNNPVLYSDHTGKFVIEATAAAILVSGVIAAIGAAITATVMSPGFRKSLTDAVNYLYDKAVGVIKTATDKIKTKVEQSFARAKTVPQYKSKQRYITLLPRRILVQSLPKMCLVQWELIVLMIQRTLSL